ncbi:MAG: DUF2269 domain-containing protein [Chloroflexi bacterium]|nr:DUF2269 domain-containing protein [Chloroflexota bacterium]
MDALWIFLHEVGAFVFVGTHSVAVAVAFEIRQEERPERLRTLLNLSARVRPVQYIGLAVLLVGGLAAAWTRGWWSWGWVWASLALLAVLVVGALPLVPHFRRWRQILGQAGKELPEEARQLARSPLLPLVATYETVGLVVILWLMVAKPF